MEHLVDKEVIDFLVKSRQNTNKMYDLGDMLVRPLDFAKRFDIDITENVEKKLLEIGKIGKSKGYQPDDKINDEIIVFFNKVLVDGRFIEEWITDPELVSKVLNINVSKEAIERIREIHLDKLIDISNINNSKQVDQNNIAIIIVIVLVVVFVIIPKPAYVIQEVVMDPKDINKL